MENSNQPENFFNLGVDAHAHDYLKDAANWAKVIAIVAFVSAGLSIFSAFLGKSGVSTAMSIAAAVIFSLVVAGISIAINLFLLKFAQNTASALTIKNQEQFNEGINNLRIYFKILGIIIIIVLSLLVLFLLFYVLGRGIAG